MSGKLTAVMIRGFKAAAKPRRHFDGGGLYVEVTTSGAKIWRMKYRIKAAGGKRIEKSLTFGPWNTTAKPGHLTIKDARLRVAEAKAELAQGRDPAVAKKLARATRATEEADTFRRLGDAWVIDEAHRMRWTTKHELNVARSLERHLYPILGELPAAYIRAGHVFPIIQQLVRRAPSSADKIEQRVRAILDFGVYSGAMEINPLPAKRRTSKRGGNYPAIVDLEQLQQLMDKAEAADLSNGIRRAHLLLAYTVQRVGEVVAARWEEFDLEEGIWTIPRDRMKVKATARADQVIPLADELLYMLRRWSDIATSEYVCVGPRTGRPVTATSVEKLYRETLGYRGRHSPHSWRSAFSTLAHDAGQDHGAIEAALDHVTRGVAGVYDRGTRFEMRRGLMQWWSEQISS